MRRGRCLVVQTGEVANPHLELPTVDVDGPHLEQQFQERFFQLTGLKCTTIGSLNKFPFQSDGEEVMWAFVVLQRPPEFAVVHRADDKTTFWESVAALTSQAGTGKFLNAVLKEVSEQPGNAYAQVKTNAGVDTFAHLSTGELLHGQAGPFQEAWNFYAEALKLKTAEGDRIIYDLGLGAGTHALACRKAWLENDKLKNVRVYSFDLEKNGIKSLLSSIESFPYAQEHKSFLENAALLDEVIEVDANRREFHWTFIKGDFVETSAQLSEDIPKADAIFFDFFSPESHPQLWKFRIFEAIANRSSHQAILATTSSATAIRANLASVGFFLGFGIPSGKKGNTTVAAMNLNDLAHPFPSTWVQTFFRSHIPHLECEEAEVCQKIKNKVQIHPQFIQS
jgi:tRNA U34 5-methylaminomethyl-2-thiouridine-forming methyltransferase MnmC